MNFYAQCFITTTLFYIPLKLYFHNRISPVIFYAFLCVVILVSVIFPLIFYSSLALQRGVLYFYFLDKADPDILRNPQKTGLTNVRNFYIANGNISLGTWHILPTSYPFLSNRTDEDYLQSLSDEKPVVLYIHGNIGTRASKHRLHLYKTFQSLDYHIITFDYRCFGDSTYSTPNEKVVVSDCMAVADWLLRHIGSSPLFLWGHSLGTGMTTNVAAMLARQGVEVKGVILEAPFDNMPSEIKVHPFGRIFRILPWYNALFSNPYYTNGEDFYSSKYILEFNAPVMILHSEDDTVIPCKLGMKLYREGLLNRKHGSGPMSINFFDAKHKFGHTEMCTAKEMPEIIRTFVDKYKNESFSTTTI